MAVFTVTCSDQAAQPRMNETGLTVVKALLKGADLPASFSASDIILIAKIPNGALLVDGYVSGTCGGDTNLFKIGTAASETAFTAGITISETAVLKRATGIGLPFKVSISDDAMPQWTWLYATRISGSATVTCSIQFVVMYAMPGAI